MLRTLTSPEWLQSTLQLVCPTVQTTAAPRKETPPEPPTPNPAQEATTSSVAAPQIEFPS
jgi:hypothetical protein